MNEYLEVRLFRMLLTILFLAAISGLGAPARAETDAKSFYDYCKERNGVLSWSRGISFGCALPASGGSTRSDLIAKAQSICERTTRQRLPNALKGKIPCRTAYDGRRITDPVFSNALRSWPDIPVRLRIFDKPSGKIQETSGVVQRLNFNGSSGVYSIRVRAQGATVCEGTFKGAMFSVRFTVKCFGEIFKGSASSRHVIKTGSIYNLVPKSVKVSQSGSYIEMFFQ